MIQGSGQKTWIPQPAPNNPIMVLESNRNKNNLMIKVPQQNHLDLKNGKINKISKETPEISLKVQKEKPVVSWSSYIALAVILVIGASTELQ